MYFCVQYISYLHITILSRNLENQTTGIKNPYTNVIDFRNVDFEA